MSFVKIIHTNSPSAVTASKINKYKSINIPKTSAYKELEPASSPQYYVHTTNHL